LAQKYTSSLKTLLGKDFPKRYSFFVQSTVFQRLFSLSLECLVYPSIWVALGLASLTYFIQTTLNLPADWRPIALIFAMALIPYNLDRIVDSYVQTIPDPKIQGYFRSRGVFILLAIAILVAGILLFLAPTAVRRVSLGGFVPLVYGIPLLPIRQQNRTRWYRLKDIPGAKAWIVDCVLTYAVVAVPLAYAGAAVDRTVVLLIGFLLVFIGTNSHLFDVRDLDSDRQKGVQTLPVLIGIRGTRVVLTTLNLLLIPLMTWSWTTPLPSLSPGIVVPSILVNLLAIWTLSPTMSRNVYDVGLDGGLFLPSLLVWIGSLMP
jgi:4-hydroxybenzoate polyprenyltransferase